MKRRTMVAVMLVAGLGFASAWLQAENPVPPFDNAANSAAPPKTQRSETPKIAASTTVEVLSETPERVRVIYRLKAAPSQTVVDTIQRMLNDENTMSVPLPYAVADPKKLVIVPDPIGNGILVSGPPGSVSETLKLIDRLDQSPRTVMLDIVVGESLQDAAESTRDAEQKLPLEKQPPGMKTVIRLQMTLLENQPGFSGVSASVDLAALNSKTATVPGETPHALTVGVTPRIDREGTATMEFDLHLSLRSAGNEKSKAQPETKVASETLATNFDMQTTVSIPDGQSQILGSVVQPSEHGKRLWIVATPHVLK